MPNKQTLADHYEREQAVNIHQSYIVSAPAGSGKTGLLTTRVLKLLAIVNKPEEILCITFTRKAAAEMRERIFETLKEADDIENIDSLNVDDYQKQRLKLAKSALQNSHAREWDIFNTSHRLKISTIDGFCRSISAKVPLLSQMGVNTNATEQAEPLYKEAIDLWFHEKLEENAEILTLIHSHFGGDLEKFTAVLTNLLSIREQWLPLTATVKHQITNETLVKEYFEEQIHDIINDTVFNVQSTLAPYESELCGLLLYASKNLSKNPQENPLANISKSYPSLSEFPDGTAFNLENFWLHFPEFLLTQKNELRKSVRVNNGFPAGDKKHGIAEKQRKDHFLKILNELGEIDDLVRKVEKLRILPQAQLNANDWMTLSILVKHLPELVAYLQIAFSNKKTCDFTEFTLATLRALNDESGDLDLQQKLDYQIKHILIDEFQDTSQPQLQLLESLIDQWMPDEDKTLFIVGDGMQSCYAFRNANVGIFLGIKQSGIKNIRPIPLELTVNFRSSKNIMDWVNQIFQLSFPKKDDVSNGAVAYSPSLTAQGHLQNSGVHCKFIQHDELTVAKTLEAQDIAQKIITAKYDNPKESIAILCKHKSGFIPVIEALNKNKIAFNAVDLDPLMNRRCIQDIHNITRICIDPSDKIAWIALCRSSFVALNFTELHTVFGKSHNHNYSHLSYIERLEQIKNISDFSKNSQITLDRFFTAFREFERERVRKSFSNMVETFWLQVGGPLSLQSENDYNDIQTYLKTLKNSEKAHAISDLFELEQSLQKLFSQTTHHPENTIPVQLMTMHKSKGLEFDRVFLPSLQAAGRSDDKKLLYWQERTEADGHTKFLLAPLQPAGTLSDESDEINSFQDQSILGNTDASQNSLANFIAQSEKDKQNLEDVRVLYVACTRAKKHLHISACLKWDDKKERLKAPGKNSMVGKLWNVLEPHFTPLSIDDINNSINKKSISIQDRNKVQIKQIPASWQCSVNHANPIAEEPDKAFDNSKIDVFTEFTDSSYKQREIGIFIHRILHAITVRGAKKWKEKCKTPTSCERITHVWTTQFIQNAFNKTEAKVAAQFILDCILGVLNDDTGLWLLDNRHTCSASELSVFGQNASYIIDRTFVDVSSENIETRWIIDYKTFGVDLENLLDHDLALDPTCSPRSSSAWPIEPPTQGFIQEQLSQYEEQLSNYKNIMRDYDLKNGKHYEYRTALYFPVYKALNEYS